MFRAATAQRPAGCTFKRVFLKSIAGLLSNEVTGWLTMSPSAYASIQPRL